ncbi:hypothetical protein [Flavobacterium defluvii]|nr:hypothetical protein [Flavobacterium defluvii]
MQNTVGAGPSSKKAFNIDIANASDSELGALNHAFNRHASELSVLIDKPIKWAKKDNLASMMDNFNEAVNLIETQGTKVGKTRVPYGEKGSGVNVQSTEADVYIYQHTSGKEYYSYRRSSDNQFISAGEKTRNINISN